MVVKSVFTVISICKTKIALIGAPKDLGNFGYGRREPIFQVWGGGKRGHQNFSKILGGDQSLTHYENTRENREKPFIREIILPIRLQCI